MRWSLTSPDGIGDFLLRLPWLLEMERQGWTLQLLAREATLEAARLVGLRGEFVPLRLSPYSKEAKRKRNPFAREARAIRKFRPDLIFFGPSHPTMFEEELASRLRGPKIWGFVPEDDFWPSESLSNPREIAAHYDIKVAVSGGDPEPIRNAKAAAMLVGGAVNLEVFHFSNEHRKQLRGQLSGDFRDYLVVSPGYRAGDYFKGLGRDRWICQLRELEAQCPLRFVFTGAASEAASNAEIFFGLRNPCRHLDMTGRLDGLVDLLAVLEGGRGYIGKDSGTMHLAAALEKPLVAVFGGGHGSRFLPVGTKAVILTVAVSCRGCDWRCHLEEPLCVTDLREGAVAQAWLAMRTLRDREVRTIEQQPGPDALNVLARSPGKGFPARAHEQRRERLKEERRRALAPLARRVWRGLTALWGQK